MKRPEGLAAEILRQIGECTTLQELSAACADIIRCKRAGWLTQEEVDRIEAAGIERRAWVNAEWEKRKAEYERRNG
jgi:hypothetical protein